MKYKIKSIKYPDDLSVILCDHCYENSNLSYDIQVTASYGLGDCVVCAGITDKESH
jgi:hypothetical protein